MRKQAWWAVMVLMCAVVLVTSPMARAQEDPAPATVTAGTRIVPSGPYTPPPCVAGVPFADVTCTTFYDGWIEQFARDGITAGCGGGNYCPNENVTRAQMAVFIEAAMRGTANWPAHTQIVWAVKAADGSPDTTASGAALLAAVAAIPTSGNDVPSDANHWLVKVGPGTYNFGATYLDLPAYVDLEGSGVETTTLTGTANQAGTVITEGRNTIRNVSIMNYGATNAYALYGRNGRLILRGVDVEASGGTSFGIGIYLDNEMLDVEDSHIMGSSIASAYGIYSNGTQYHSMVISKSLIVGADYTIRNSAGYVVNLAYTALYDGALFNVAPGTYTCIGNYNRSYVLVTCP